MGRIWGFLSRTRSTTGRWDWTDWFTFGYLGLGVLLMFGPVFWLMISSLKTEAEIQKFPPRFLPYSQETVAIEGYDEGLPLFLVTDGDYAGSTLAQVRRIGLVSRMVDPENPDEIFNVDVSNREPIERVAFAWENYGELFERFNFLRYLWNSTFITAVAAAIMLLVNSMAAFALSKYQFRGRNTVLLIVIGTLMIPQSVVLVPLYMITGQLGLLNSPWGVIWPAVATPTGVFMLRQYMLTIPDEILDAARMDKASEWKIFWRIILPLSTPAIAVLAILAVMWRWNDFLWPLVVLNETDEFTLQLALNSFQGEFSTQWSNLLAMTVLTLLPIALVFMFLQKFIATGIASTGGK